MIFLIGRLDLARLAVNSLVAVNSATTSVYRPKKRGKFPVRLGAALRIRIRSDPNLVCLILIRIINSNSDPTLSVCKNCQQKFKKVKKIFEVSVRFF